MVVFVFELSSTRNSFAGCYRMMFTVTKKWLLVMIEEFRKKIHELTLKNLSYLQFLLNYVSHEAKSVARCLFNNINNIRVEFCCSLRF